MATIALPVHDRGGQTRTLIVMCGLLVLINYIDRGNLATAGPLIKDQLRIDNTTFGLLISAFFWTYAPGQVVSGWLAQRFDARRVLAGGLAIWALATIATGFAGGLVSLFVLRLVLGAGESVTFPTISKLSADHLPPERYGAANAATAVGISFGPAFGIYIGGMLMASVGWRPSFVLFGLVSLLWLLPWMRQRQDEVPPHASQEPAPTYSAMLAKRQLWGSAITLFCTNYPMYLLLAWLPLYLVKARGLSMTSMAAMGGVVYLVQGISGAFWGWLADRWIARGMSVSRARMTMLAGGCALIGTALPLVGSSSLPVVFATLAFNAVCGGMTASSIFATGQTLAGPRAAGRWVGVQNFVGNFAGILAPIITGWIVDTTGLFSAAFWIASAIMLIGALSMLILVRRIEPVAWD